MSLNQDTSKKLGHKVTSSKRLEHLKRICDWIYRLRGRLPDAIPVVDLLMLLRGPLLVSEKEIRALAIRVLRYTLNTVDDVKAFEGTFFKYIFFNKPS